jgi:TonB family protein
MSHFDRLAIVKAKPQYPPAAKAKGITGKVRVKIIVNNEGFVERTCPMRISGALETDQRLTVAAEAAALQWTFQPNFGLIVIGELKLNYVEDILDFEFVIQQDERK